MPQKCWQPVSSAPFPPQSRFLCPSGCSRGRGSRNWLPTCCSEAHATTTSSRLCGRARNLAALKRSNRSLNPTKVSQIVARRRLCGRFLKWHDQDTKDADATEKDASVAELVRLRTSIMRCPMPHNFDFKKALFRRSHAFRVPISQLLNWRCGWEQGELPRRAGGGHCQRAFVQRPTNNGPDQVRLSGILGSQRADVL